MAVPTIALYASPPSTVYEFEVSSRTPSSSATSSQKSAIGGLSCLFSSPNVKYSSSSSSFIGGSDELCRGDDLKELSGSLCFSPGKICGSLLRRDQSPVSVLQCPVSSSCGSIRVRDRYWETGSVRGGVSGLFNGFVRNALGSCINYDSPRFEVDGSSSGVVVDELTFNMEDGFGDGDCEPCAMELLTSARSSYKVFCDEVVVKAFYEAEKAHRGQIRASGDPYLQHCVETGTLLASIGANSTVVAAGLLHDTLDDSFMSYDYIFKTFGAGVADLVEGVSKLSELSELARHNDTANKSVEADRLHTMFLAMADARAVLIKLADRLHNMKTLDALPFSKRQRFAKETLEIFAPLANRLGISSWKQQLENLCFKHLNPEQHELLSSKLVESFDEAMITSAVEKLELALKNESISYHVVSGRHKSLYSIYRKMLKKKLNVDEIHDLHGLRLIVDNLEDCYGALNVVHQLWSQVPGKFKDYIAQPKFNGYQSLHTVVMDESMVPFEVQIRTKEMHLQAEFGFAAHWRYKEGDCEHSTFVLRMVEWARWVVTWQCEAMSKDSSVIGFSDTLKPPCTFPTHADDCPYSYIPQCGQEGPVFVILIENDKMSVHEFPANSSVMDLLERAGRGSSRWSPYGFPVKEELKPRLNHKPISNPKCKLKMGDVVELTPSIPDKSLTEYREEIQRMYDRGLAVSSTSAPASSVVGWRM